ncbi:hypothetical protein I6Y99_003345 [Vibrio parahaemolyticus]|uniref:Response receiver domain-containing protein n=1 Tax=Vibrio parahaemolyticus TaxID=670 RepID=A0A7Y0S4U4_VIBPH|nr:hypothetical protein [Vibrio parahaemolyticus]EGQ7792744.1 hypothetical protein [Vibrio parahaemolyticus]EGQ7809360.1 hypothetical protein [Vibrio parahaemolyticus]EGQ8533264.1 hypothetical protein [Vibrio parahaemolyticus]EHC7287165.1 hypothetical protein [Vibrio parahaemolyticus]EIV8648105.1 hypothetical protein [Vibrio parahaemolyticus]
MISLPGIVLVDDKKEDLDSIQNSLISAGYPCFPIHYQNNEPSNISGIDHVNLEMVHPRVIITDLNLQELQVDAKRLVGPIADVLEKIAIEGPYLLYFWSRNAKTVQEVMDLVEQRYPHIPYPIHWDILDKTQFNSRPSELKERVMSLFAENPMFNALFGWENRVSSAAKSTTDALFKLARPNTQTTISAFKDETTAKLKTMLAVIGNETLGVKNAKDEPEVAIELGLEPVLHNHIRSNYEHIERSIWLDASDGIGKRLPSESYQDIKAYLNSFYHIEQLQADAPKNKRGTWIEFDKDYLELASNLPKIQNNLGRNIKTLINEEFLDCNQGTSATRRIAHESTKLGFIELSAECDQAQRKTKLNRYFLSAMIPKEHENFTFFRGGKNDTAHAGVYRLPNVVVDGNEYIVKVSFMYQVGAIPDFNKWLGKPKFRLKDQILSDISFKASQHASRPGIIRFD